MDMIHHIFNAIGGMQGFGAISMCLFVAVFTGAFIWAFCQKRNFLDSMGTMPLRDEEPVEREKGENHHE